MIMEDYKEKYEEAKEIMQEKGRDPHGWRSS